MNGNIDTSFIRSVVGFMLKRKIEVEIKGSEGSFTDGKKITIGFDPTFKKLSQTEQKSILLALAVHESQHILSSSFKERQDFLKWSKDKYKDKKNSDVYVQIAMDLQNILEDGRIENIASKNYVGTQKHLRFLNLFYWGIGEEKEISSTVQSNKSPEIELWEFLQGIWSLSKLGINPKNFSTFSPEVKETIKKNISLVKKGVVARDCKTCTNIVKEIMSNSMDFLEKRIELLTPQTQKSFTNEDYNTSEETQMQNDDKNVISIMGEGETKEANKSQNQSKPQDENKKEKDDQSQEKESQDSQSSQSSIESSIEEKEEKEGESEQSQAQEKNDQSSSKEEKDGQANGEDDKKDDPSKEENEINDEDLEKIVKKALKKTKKEVKEEISKIEEKEIREKAKNSNKKDPPSKSKQKQRNITKLDVDSLLKRNFYIDFQYLEEIRLDKNKLIPASAEVSKRGQKFKEEILEILKSKQRETLFEQREGILDPELITQVSFNKDIFLSEKVDDLSEYVFYLLKDNSGSMSGIKNFEAFNALAVIEEGLRDFPLKIVQFDCYDRTITHEIIKDWTDDDKNVNYSLSAKNSTHTGGSNADGIDISLATKELLERPEKDKILIVLSDGLPINVDVTKFAIADARKKGIGLIGIFFSDGEEMMQKQIPQIKKMYEKNIICTTPENIFKMLKKTLLQVIS